MASPKKKTAAQIDAERKRKRLWAKKSRAQAKEESALNVDAAVSARSPNIIQLPGTTPKETYNQRLINLKESCLAAIEVGVVHEQGNARAKFVEMGLRLVEQAVSPEADVVQIEFDTIRGQTSIEESA